MGRLQRGRLTDDKRKPGHSLDVNRPKDGGGHGLRSAATVREVGSSRLSVRASLGFTSGICPLQHLYYLKKVAHIIEFSKI